MIEHLFHNDHGEREAILSFLGMYWPIIRTSVAAAWARVARVVHKRKE